MNRKTKDRDVDQDLRRKEGEKRVKRRGKTWQKDFRRKLDLNQRMQCISDNLESKF
jgi:hypothetical protein